MSIIVEDAPRENEVEGQEETGVNGQDSLSPSRAPSTLYKTGKCAAYCTCTGDPNYSLPLQYFI